MGTGYTRNDTPNNIADGNVINASDLDGEFDAIQSAFNASTGHSHDGTTGEGPQIATAGLADNAVTTVKITDANVITAKIADANVTTAKIADANVTTAKIADANVTTAKIADVNVTTAKIANNAVTSAKLDTNIQVAGTLGVTGETTLTTHLNMGDNDIIKLGDSADLQIYHSGSASVIKDGGTGDLYIAGSTNVKITNGDINEDMAVFTHNGAVTLNYNNSPKFATTATGIDVTGTVTADGLTVDTSADGIVSTFKGNLNYFYIKGSGADTILSTVGSGGNASNLFFQTDPFTSEVNRMQINKDGDISFYEDTGTTPKFSWSSSNETIAIGLGASSTATISAYSRTVSAGLPSALRIIENTGASTYWDIGANNGASPNLNFYVNANTSPKMTLSSSGNVGIGTSSPAQLLHVNSTGNVAAAQIQGASHTAKISTDGAGTIFGSATNGYMLLTTNAAERMRIDASGNLLVGTTSTIPFTFSSGTGAGITSTGTLMAGATAEAGLFNRVGGDGNIVNFYRAGSIVGNIGTATTTLGTNPYIAGSAGRGLSFDVSSNAIFPCSSTGARSDGSANLGASTARFNELYLSGGVYLGGTGSANLLDDYEEGTWSISYTGTGYGSMANLDGSSNGVYRKVGDIVYFSIKMTATTALAIDPTVDRGVFYGLPFTSGSGSGQVGFVSGFMSTSSGFNQGATFTGAVSQGAQSFQLWCSQEHAATNLTYIVVSGMYHV